MSVALEQQQQQCDFQAQVSAGVTRSNPADYAGFYFAFF